MNKDETSPVWLWLSRITQMAVPLLLAWGVWVTTSLYAHGEALARIEDWKNLGPRFTAVDADRLRLQILQEQSAKFESIQNDLTRIKILLEEHMKKETKP